MLGVTSCKSKVTRSDDDILNKHNDSAALMNHDTVNDAYRLFFIYILYVLVESAILKP